MTDPRPDGRRLRRLYERHGRALLGYACALVHDRADAQDILHQVFLRLMHGDVVAGDLSPGYLFRAVRNRALNDIRRRSREVSLDQETQWLESPSASAETILVLQSALRALPEAQREVVTLRVWGELTFEEIGKVVDVSPNTAASRYRYGLAKLKEIWHE